MLTVRRATQNDLLDIFKLCVAMHQETDFGNFPLNPEKMIAQLSHWKDHSLLLVAEDDGKIVGMMAGSKRDQWYSDEFLAAEDFIFVDKDHRGTRAAFLLMREFMQWATQAGAKHIRAGVATGTGAAAERLYKHFGLNFVGGNYTAHLARS